MSAETQIPEDIMRSAQSALNQAVAEPLKDDAYVIANAILAERTRCAAVADRYGNFEIDTEDGEGYATAASNIAAAIRAGA
jgi:hypothetical protein